MQRNSLAVLIVVAVFTIAGAQPSLSQTVKVTPLGSHDGEFCRLDRAMIFEDPDSTRILYDAGARCADRRIHAWEISTPCY
jgi:hypothetical protein